MNKNYLTNFLIILFFVFIMIIGLTNYNSQDNILLGDVTNTPGDVNNDGKISSKDYIMIKKHILKTTTLTNDETRRADINNDGKVSTSDYIMIKKVILGLLPKPTPKVTPKPVVTNTPTPITTPKPIVTSTPTPTIKPTVTPIVTPKPVATATPIPKPSKIHFLNTDESDAILIESNGEYGLMDTSWPDNTYVTTYLDKLGVKKLKYVIISHSDMDHIGGVPTLSKYLDSYTTYYYRSVHVSTNDVFYNRAISTMNKANVKKVDVLNKNNINFTIGDFKIELMNTAGLSSDETTDNDNKNSIVAYVTYKGKYGTLLTGDMESQDEYRMASVISSKTVDVLKVAHHSWQSSTTMKFVKAIRPKIAIVTNTQILEDISTPVYYMQQVYKTKFYLTGKSDDAVVIDYVNNLSVTPTKAISETYKVVNKSNQWRQLQNGIWFYIKSGTDLNTIAHNEWVYYNNKWYYLGIQGNMMIGFVETKYTDNGKTKVGVFYLDRDGAMLTGWQQPTEYGPYDKSNLASIFHATYVYSHENYLIKNCYEYTGAWADGKKWFYFDPILGYMLHNESRVINGKSYTFDRNGICISDGC